MPIKLALFVEIFIGMSLIGKNIKKIRAVKKLSQTAFADLLNLSRTSVGAYEEERAEPKIDTLLLIANHFGISVDRLLSKEVTMNEVLKFDKHSERFLKKETQPVNLNYSNPIFDLGRLDEYHQYKTTGTRVSDHFISFGSHIKPESKVFRVDRELRVLSLQKGDLIVCSQDQKAVFGYLLITGNDYDVLKEENEQLSGLSIIETISFGSSSSVRSAYSIESRLSYLENEVEKLKISTASKNKKSL